MTDSDKTVFISYRRSVSWSIARLIFDALKRRGFDMFMDVETINSGKFDTIILDQIANRSHFLIILTRGSLDRCNEPGDWLRREIECAMETHRNVVPILVGGFSFAEAETYLTGKLTGLKRYNGLPLLHEYFDEAIERLYTRYLMKSDSPMRHLLSLDEQTFIECVIQDVIDEMPATDAELHAIELFEQGLVYLKRGHLQGAIACFSDALQKNASLTSAYYYRGVSQHLIGKLVNAIQDYTHCLTLDLRAPRVFSNRAEAYFELQEYKSALADFEQAIQLHPSFIFAIAGRAISLYALGQQEEAKSVWGSLVEIDSRFSNLNWAARRLEWTVALTTRATELVNST